MAGTWVVEFAGRRLSDDATVTFLFANGKTVSFTDHGPAKSGLVSFDVATQLISVDSNGIVQSSEDPGEFKIANAPADITLPGPWDALRTDYSFKGQAALIYWAPGKIWANRTLVALHRLEQSVDNLTFPLRDPRADLDAQLQSKTFAGDNTPPNGVEGESDLKGKREPVTFGPSSNTEADKVNAQKLIYQINSQPGTVLVVRDGGVPLTAAATRASLADMQATAPLAGTYDLYSGSEGLFVRLCNQPAFRLTFDTTTGATDADRTHAQIWQAIRTGYCGTDPGDIDAASVTAMDSDAPNEAGFTFRDETRRQAIDRVLQSLSGFERQNLDGSWSIHRLEAPSGDPDLALVTVTPDTKRKTSDRAIISIVPARASYTPDGAPPRAVQVQWGLNNTQMAPSDFAGSAAVRLVDKFKDQWRVEPASDPTVWDPDTQTGDFPDAPVFTISTGYQPPGGGNILTCPHAAAEAARLLALYAGMRGQFEITYRRKPSDPMLLPGQVVRVTYPAYGLYGGPLFVVLQSRLQAQGRKAQASVVVGFQT